MFLVVAELVGAAGAPRTGGFARVVVPASGSARQLLIIRRATRPRAVLDLVLSSLRPRS